MAASKRQSFVAVVDDDAGMREAIESLLNSAGLDTFGYESAEAFLRSSSARDAGCLVLDMRLPGINGLQLYARLREEGCRAPAILLTADPDRDGQLRAQALAAGMRALLYKPFDGEALVSLARSALEKAPF